MFAYEISVGIALAGRTWTKELFVLLADNLAIARDKAIKAALSRHDDAVHVWVMDEAFTRGHRVVENPFITYLDEINDDWVTK